jgi:hypothetical protein
MIEEMSNPQGYQSLLRSLKERIQQAQIRAALAVTHELVPYWFGLGRRF